MRRTISFERACAQYVHRYTMDHVPAWAMERPDAQRNGDPIRADYYAPQFASDREWYDNTLFHGESELATRGHCYTSGQAWPLGHWLDKPYRKGVKQTA